MTPAPFRRQRASRPWFLPRFLFMDARDFPAFVLRKLGLR